MGARIGAVLTCLLVLAVPARTAEPGTLAALMRSPGENLGRETAFRCRYAATTALFKTGDGVFAPDRHINFAVWPDTVRLWDREERKNVLPTLYIDTSRSDLALTLGTLRQDDMIRVAGTVIDVQDVYPRILVSVIVREDAAGHDLEMIRLPEPLLPPPARLSAPAPGAANAVSAMSVNGGELRALLPFPGESGQWVPRTDARRRDMAPGGTRNVSLRPGEAIRVDSAGVVSVVPAAAFERGIRAGVGPTKTDVNNPIDPATRALLPGGVSFRKNGEAEKRRSNGRIAAVGSPLAYASPAPRAGEPLSGLEQDGAAPAVIPFESDPFPPGAFVRRTPASPDKDPHRPGEDASAMTVPGDSRVRRTEVRLPGSSQGFGHTSDYR